MTDSSAIPVPVARCLRGAQLAKSRRARSEALWLAWEASLRLSVAVRGRIDAERVAAATPARWAAAFESGDVAVKGPGAARVVARADRREPRDTEAGIDAEELVGAVVRLASPLRARVAAPFDDALAAALERALAEAWSQGAFLPPGTRLVWCRPRPHPAWTDVGGPVPRVVTGGPFADVASPGPGLHAWCAGRWVRLADHVQFHGDERDATAYFHVRRTPAVREYTDLDRGTLVRVGARHVEPVLEELRPVARLGDGERGPVHIAQQSALDRDVAVRRPAGLGSTVDRERFERAVERLARLEHPNLVRVLAPCRIEGALAYAMERVIGPPLHVIPASGIARSGLAKAVRRGAQSLAMRYAAGAAWLAAEGDEMDEPPPASDGEFGEVALVLAGAARALAHVHEAGLTHGAVHAANIVVTWPERRGVLGEPSFDEALRATERGAMGRLRRAGRGVTARLRARREVAELARIGEEFVAGPAGTSDALRPPPRGAQPLIDLLRKAGRGAGFPDATSLAEALEAFARRAARAPAAAAQGGAPSAERSGEPLAERRPGVSRSTP